MDELRSILVGVDFTPGSAAALRHAARLAKPRSTGGAPATIRAVHIINTYVVVDLERALSTLQKNIQASLEAEAHREWLKFESDLPGRESIEFVVRVGNAGMTMAREAADTNADLLTLGMHREDGSKSGAGTVASMCVRSAACPVLLVNPGHPASFRHVMACVDMSPSSRRVVAEAARLARIEGASLDIVHVFEPPWRQLHYFAPMPENSPEFQSKYRAFMLAKLREFFEPLKPDLEGITCDYKLEDHHNAGHGIIEYATNNNVDLIVLGTHGRGGFREFLLGSTAERVLRLTPCSMMTVPERPD